MTSKSPAGALLVLASILAAPLPVAAQGAAIRLEAESYVLAYDIAPDDIEVRNGILYGLDYPGEWTQYELVTTRQGAHAVAMLCWGETNFPYHLRLVLDDPPGATQAIDLRFVGRGTCGA
jgi:hypothetical protein